MKTHLFKHPVLLGCVVFLLSMALTLYMSNLINSLQKAKDEKEMINTINAASSRLQENLYRSLAVAKTLNFIVEKYGYPEDLGEIGEDLLKINKSIDAIELLKQGEIVQVYPKTGNESVIGYDIFKDTNRNKEAQFAKDNKAFYFAGPIKLKQGGIGVVGRLPIFINGEFKGFSAVVIRFEELLKRSGILPSFNQDFVFQLTKLNPNTGQVESFINNGSVIVDFKNSLRVNVPMGHWDLYVARKDSTFNLYFWIYILIGFLLSLFSGYIVYLLSKQPAYLKRKIQEKVDSLHRNENLLDITQNTAKVGSWEYDIVDGTMYWTDLTKQIYGVKNDSQPSYNDFLNCIVSVEQREVLDAAIKACTNNGTQINIETKIQRIDGKIIWVKITGKYNDGSKTPTIFGATQDINELVESKTEKVDILESINDAFIACNNQFLVIYVNKAFASLIDRPVNTLLNSDIHDVLDAKVLEFIKRDIEQAMKNSEKRVLEFFSEKWNIWLEIGLYYNSKGFTAYLKNITIQMQHLKELKIQNEKFKKIAWMQSHVVRAPLVNIIAAVALINEKDLNDKSVTLFKIIKDSSADLDRVISEISETASTL